MGDRTTRYDRLADHFSRYIRGEIVFQYTGPYRWKIDGLAEIPNTLDLADDHVQFKRSKIAKLSGKPKRKCKLCALSSFPRLRRQAVSEIGRSRGGQQESSPAARMKSVKPTGSDDLVRRVSALELHEAERLVETHLRNRNSSEKDEVSYRVSKMRAN